MLVHYGTKLIQKQPDSNNDAELNLALPVLGDLCEEEFPHFNSPSTKQGSFQFWENDLIRFGFTKVKMGEEGTKEVSRASYSELFELTKGAFLYRVWNYLPEINQGEGDEERYKQFCEGRSEAFHQAFGDKTLAFMPAGSCVGIDGDEMVICFLAGFKSPDHHENPNQVPAYRYPRQYGSRSPSFARATSIHLGNQLFSFISGTAAVVGHESQGGNNLQKQLEVTCDNLEIIALQIPKPFRGTNHRNTIRNGKVYLRHAHYFAEARKSLELRFPQWVGSLIYLRSDICRKELLVEIELSIIDEEDHTEAV